jgi:hypothetical protein
MKRAPALIPVVGQLTGGDLDQRAAGRRRQIGQGGQLAGCAIDRVLDDVGADLDLLDPARRQLEQLRQDDLGILVAHPDGQAQHLVPRVARHC